MLSQPSLLATGSFNDQLYLCTYEDHPLTSFSHLQLALTYFTFRLLRIFNSPCCCQDSKCDHVTLIWLQLSHLMGQESNCGMAVSSAHYPHFRTAWHTADGVCQQIHGDMLLYFSLNSVLWNVDFPFFWYVQCATVQAVAAWHICLLGYPTLGKGACHNSVNCWVLVTKL